MVPAAAFARQRVAAGADALCVDDVPGFLGAERPAYGARMRRSASASASAAPNSAVT